MNQSSKFQYPEKEETLILSTTSREVEYRTKPIVKVVSPDEFLKSNNAVYITLDNEEN